VPGAPDRFVVKGRGYPMDIVGLMRPEDMVVCDLEGFKVDGPKGISQCYEVKMHSCIYRARPDVQSVVHVHPRWVNLMTILGKTLRQMSSGTLLRKALPVYPHSRLVVTDEDGSAVAAILGQSRAVILKGHGIATTGRSLEESVMAAHGLEEQAKLNAIAWSLAGKDHPVYPEELMEESANRPDYSTIPHFKDSFDPSRRGTIGTWRYFSDKVSKDL